MTTQVQATSNDLALLRALAPAGRDGAALGGSVCLAAGAIYGCANLLAWAVSTRAGPPQGLGWIWLVATAVFLPIVYMPLARLRVSGSPRAGVLSRTVGSAGWGVAGAIFALVIAFGAASARMEDGRVWQAYSLCLFAICGLGWLVAALAARKTWMGAIAAGCFATAMAAGLLIGSPVLYLLFAASLVGLLAIPGLVLIRRPPQARA